jgi:hypothetical protein
MTADTPIRQAGPGRATEAAVVNSAATGGKRTGRLVLLGVLCTAGWLAFGELGRKLRLRLMIALSVSQACWWTAVLIGLINSTLRRWSGI